ncbi:MAG TPA: hypothetical protein QGF58_01375 [Myxococcota bacterium]|nr:hypothetical protein [Myxococcota bacterium]
MLQALLVDPWPAWLGAGVLAIVVLLYRRVGFGALGDWKLWLGLGVGGLLARLISGRFSPDFAHGVWDQAVVPWLPLKACAFLLAGLLMGYGVRRVRSLGSPRTLILFALAAAFTANLLVRISESW